MDPYFVRPIVLGLVSIRILIPPRCVLLMWTFAQSLGARAQPWAPPGHGARRIPLVAEWVGDVQRTPLRPARGERRRSLVDAGRAGVGASLP